ncbi:neutral zinc metallopeptidase [Actinomadura algeriensis]|uniref:Metalloprotease n=1 Tax=Actinomadura algeriensis TaxID=1679523 RepID=A0ABR9JSQ5_9ACTN|nr:neutral zinc metallopeptidase [Actinomadura algeriensis]MBE1533429.1 putative metalloprotease [Actinomadura algeriensis]
MAGRTPSPGPPAYRRPAYRHVPSRRPPRRTADGTVAGVIGGVATVIVLGILGFSLFGDRDPIGAITGSYQEVAVSRETATDNELYRTGDLEPVGCALPGLEPGAASMRRFMDVLSDCLDDSWGRQFAKAGMTFDVPDRVFWRDSGRSPCGTYPSPGSSAFYCPANNTMYVGVDHIVQTSGDEPLENFAVFARVVAHEYGHHVQDLAGILLYGNGLMEAADPLGQAAASRRIELQAQCFAGAFLGAERATLPMTRRQLAVMIEDVRGRGDDDLPPAQRDHGSGRNYAGWVVTGYEGGGLAVCNTWTAPPDEVD